MTTGEGGAARGSGAPLDRALVLLVALVVIGFAAVTFAGYYANPDLLWRHPYHDRNGHLSFGIDLVLALRDLNLVAFFDHLEKARVWPPVHGLMLAAIMLVGGVDYRLGILPSLIGWSVAIVCCWLVARQAFRDRLLGIFAGAVAVTFALASPVYRLLGSDVMLEGLGAGLSALAVWAYIAARREPDSAVRWRVLAIVLTLLFFEKANYWLLVVGPLAVAAFLEEPRRWIDEARGVLRRVSVTALAGKALRDPLLLAFAAIVVVVAYLLLRGPTSIVLFGRSVSLYPPQNLVTVAYWLLFIRAALAWSRHRAALAPQLGVAGRELFYWLVVPIAVSFLLPKRLGTVIWFIGPTHYNPATGGFDLMQAVQIYVPGILEGYHVAPWAAICAVVLFAAGAIQCQRVEPAVRSVFVVAVFALTVIMIHPMKHPRFMMTAMFGVWAGAGIGAALLLDRIGMSRIVQTLVAGVAVLVLAVGSAVQPVSPRAYPFAARTVDRPSDLDLVRPWLAALDSDGPVLVAATFGSSTLFAWVTHNDCRCRRRFLQPWIGNQPSRAAVRAVMADRVAATEAQFVVIIDAPGSPYQEPGVGWDYQRRVGIVDAMEAQDRFRRVASYAIPSHGAEAVVWRRR